ncbi:glutamine ABC transporter substrate-binding protein GlnH [Corynebacterium kutscheri]|uniref:Glutamine ABC transporter substrate-binding protein GlnH n=1 Tax=Corynebacterium kutscheri TaxID=35755 RepID=A0AB38VWA7_9CORY|nr:transporter substrate-binding domain-containing protein [Corynebacterium kutscheri]VEH06172.1 glutamine ABC transporter substrate-binding protein GlnH [Corynebacterium kutscheri]VEH82085.1 glutamine ABC transporter substrate-binding protein GlnH [Corynebacterium kutscheri]
MHSLLKLIGCLGVLTLSACTAQASIYSPIDTDVHHAIMPLPEGAILEEAGTNQATHLVTTGLLGSYAPDDLSVEQRVPEILARGRLIVGVDQAQNLLSFRDPATGTISGFEIDIAREIARDIFGDPTKVEFRYTDASTWIQALNKNTVDFVIRGISITRERQDAVFFSTPYMTVETRMLAKKNSDISSLADLSGKTACVTSESTGLQRLRESAPDTNLLITRASADCLVALQQNHTDVVVSDATILSGMIAQDPTTRIVGDSLGQEDYGIAFAKPINNPTATGLIRQVNATFERIFANHQWVSYYYTWFGDYLPLTDPPPLRYRLETAPAITSHPNA